MDIVTLSFVGLVTAAAALFLTGRALPVRRIVKMTNVLDVVVTIGLVAMLSGTLGGMVIAAVAGLAYSVALTALRWIANVQEAVTYNRQRGL